MSYARVQDGKKKNGVGISFTVDYQKTSTPGVYHHLRLCGGHALTRQNGIYTSAIGSRKIIIKETSGVSNGATSYNYLSSDCIQPGGNKQLSQVLSGWAATLTKETIKWATTNVDPIFKLLLSSAFSTAQSRSRISCAPGRVEMSETPWYAPRGTIRNNPMFEVFELQIALTLAAGASGTNISGPVDYEVTMEGETYPNYRQAGPTGVVGSSTGKVQKSNQFTVVWR